jgi:hypothetical protein
MIAGKRKHCNLAKLGYGVTQVAGAGFEPATGGLPQHLPVLGWCEQQSCFVGLGSAKCHSAPSWLCCTRVVQPQALPARMLMAVPATTTMAISEMADWVIIRILAARDNGAVSVGLNATLVV